jgi:hypothetical protein
VIATVLALVCPGAACDDAGDEPAPPTFGELRERVLTPGCVFNACHKGAAAAGALNLEGTDEAVHAELVDAQATVAGRILVVPMDPGTSYLYEKLTSDMPAAGERMPMTGELEADRIELVRAWIEAGAAND